MTDEKQAREREPTQVDLKDAFSREFTEVAEEGLAQVGEGVAEDLAEKIREQTKKAVDVSSEALSGAIYPHLVKWWDAKVFPLSQSVQQQRAAFQQVVADQSVAQVQENILVEETNTLVNTLNLTQSVITVNTSSGVNLSSVVLWRWNETDLTQFDTTGSIQVGDMTCSLEYRAKGTKNLTAAIAFNITKPVGGANVGGYACWRIATGENLVLPNRFLLRIQYCSSSLDDSNSDISMYIGPFFHDNAWSKNTLYGFGVLPTFSDGGGFCIIPQAQGGTFPTVAGTSNQAPFRYTGGTPSHPAFTGSSSPHAIGTTVEYECYLQSFPSPDIPFVSVTSHKFGGYSSTNTNFNYVSTSFLRGASTDYAANLLDGWGGKQITSLAFLAALPLGGSGITNKKWEITEISVLKHYEDWYDG